MDKYILVPWPESQDYMEYSWFRKEAILYQAMDEQEYLDSAYFIPEHRLEEIGDQLDATDYEFRKNKESR